MTLSNSYNFELSITKVFSSMIALCVSLVMLASAMVVLQDSSQNLVFFKSLGGFILNFCFYVVGPLGSLPITYLLFMKVIFRNE